MLPWFICWTARVRVAKLMIAAGLVTFSSAQLVYGQGVEPLKVLEKERRDRLEMDQRLAREAVARRLRENQNHVLRREEQRNPLKDKAALVPGSPAEMPAGEEKHNVSEPLLPPAPSNMTVVGPSPDEARASNLVEGSSAPKLSLGEPLPTASATSINKGDDPAKPLSNNEITAVPPPPPVRVLITVDKTSQRMLVTVGGKPRYSWPVSTGRGQFETPTGAFRPLRLAKEHYSKEWDDAPMPHSIFFTSRGHAIHGSNDTRRLGRRASHGCVRLAPSKAAALFALVQAQGAGATKVTITGGGAVKTARLTNRSRKAEVSASRTGQVRRASPDAWLIGTGDQWFE